ncbi:MAG: secretin N-terminal domain-containing protein [Aeoliella sp.]
MNMKSCGAVALLCLIPLPALLAESPADKTPVAASAEVVRLEFREQPWPEVLRWLAEKSQLNLDWQELPEGTLNLTSSTEYSLAEAHDLINMQLLARGYTLLVGGEVLRVVSLENLDPTLVTRVEPDQLATLQRHQFVRVSFPLTWMIAEEAAAEFSPLLSPHGKLHPMSSTNRLEAVDAVVNLRALQRLLTQAEHEEGRREQIVEFRLEHRRAKDIAPKVRQLLGLPADESADPSLSQIDIEQTRFRAAALEQLGAGAKPLMTDRPNVHLVVNDDENSILVHARTDKIAIARQAITALDKPLPPKESPWENVNRVKTHDVEGFDAATIVSVVNSMREAGKMDEQTHVDHEAAFNRLIVYATPEDHLTVANLIRNFKSETRKAEVIPLVSLDPHYATNAVMTVLKNPARPAKIQGTASNGKFQIEPDATNNRLLLWATPDETAEVRDFLKQLGESFVRMTSEQQLHIVSTRGVGLAAIESQLQSVWSQVSEAPLVIEKSPVSSATVEEETEKKTPSDDPPAAADPSASVNPVDDRVLHSPAHVVLVAQQADAEAPPGPAPVQLIESSDGRVVIASQDPRTAAAAKALLEGLLPPSTAVRLVKLQNAEARDVKEQLTAMLKQASPTQSSTLAPLQAFSVEVDGRTNSLIIQNVSDEQSRLIDKMLPLLDAPAPKDQELDRVQQIYQVKNADAAEIAETLKEVYRDLLSRSDKTFTANINHQQLGYSSSSGSIKKEPQYQGLLSISADIDSNKLILSAPAYLIEEVMELVERLDTGPADSSIGVVQLSPGMNSAAIREALNGVLEKRKQK